MRTKRVVLCVLLSLALVVTFIPTISFAEGEDVEAQTVEDNISIEGEEGGNQKVDVMQSDEVIEATEATEETAESNKMTAPNDSRNAVSKALLDDQISGKKKNQAVKAFENQRGVKGKSYYDPICDDYDDPWIMLYYPDPMEFCYLDEVMYLDFDVYDTWEDYYTIPLIAIWDSYGNMIDIVEGEIAEDYMWTNYTGGIYLSSAQYTPGFYEFMILNVPCYGDGTYVEGWEDWGYIPFVDIWFAIPDYVTSYAKSVKVSKGKGSMTVKWKKQSKKNRKKFSGYQIRYSSNPDMSYARYVNASKKSKSKKIKKLARKTRYYVQVRTYKNDYGDIYYSHWSKVKSVKTK